jgi:tetratricopeptide (TPR) repeat protein
MEDWKGKIDRLLKENVNMLDLSVRIIASLIVFYIVYRESPQQILAIAFMVVAFLGVKKINKYALITIDKFERSIRGKIPVIGEYDTAEDKQLKTEASVSLNASLQTAMLKADNYADALGQAAKFIMVKEWVGATYFIEEALQFNPDDLDLRLQLAIIYGERIGDKEKAVFHCTEVLKKDPDNVSALFNLAVYTNHLKGSKDSLPIYLNAEKLIKKKGLLGTEIEGKLSIFLGHDYKSNGEKDNARTCYKKAIDILEPLAKKGDQSSAFWLNDARKNLESLG